MPESKYYRFEKDLRRLDTIEKIHMIFDNSYTQNSGEERHIYQGQINGINVRVYFKLLHPCKLQAKTNEDLNKAHKKALDRLLQIPDRL